MSAKALRAVQVDQRDRLTRWAIDYLLAAKDNSLAAMLEAAMERRYSANPGETFFTGAGAHTFSNFKREDDGKSPSVREALRESVNLSFIRIMRDVVYHYVYRAPDNTRPRAAGRRAIPSAPRISRASRTTKARSSSATSTASTRA